VDFEEMPSGVPADSRSLGLCVLRIWSRFFLANTQWDFIRTLGASLELYCTNIARAQLRAQALFESANSVP
jgi:hypothetical protein